MTTLIVAFSALGIVIVFMIVDEGRAAVPVSRLLHDRDSRPRIGPSVLQ